MDSKKTTGGIGFCQALALVFIGLKLAGFIDWSWWLVLSPILIPLAIFIACIIVLGVIKLIETE